MNEIYTVEVLDEWHNLCATKSFNTFEAARNSAMKIMAEDKTEQFLGVYIVDEDYEERIVASKYHGEPLEIFTDVETTRFDLMEFE